MPPRRSGGKKFFIWFVIVAIAGAIAYAAYRFMPYMAIPATTVSAPIEEKEMTPAAVLAAVEKHLVLPKEEEPIIAVVADAAALKKEQAFYANVENGDIVLVYQQNKRAIVYSPDRDVVVNVGPLIIGDQEN